MSQSFLRQVAVLALIATYILVGGLTMPFRVRSSPAGYPIKPPITAEELGAAIDFPTHLADYAKYVAQPIHNVKGYGAKGDGTPEDSAAIQTALDAGAGQTVFFPLGTYVCANLIVRPGTTIIFEPGTVLKFPPSVPDYSKMMFIGDINATDLMGPYRIIGPVTIDAQDKAAGQLLVGIYVVGAKDFVIEQVYGVGLPDGYVVHVAKSYGSSPVVPQNGIIRNIEGQYLGWGAVAVTAGKDITIENVVTNQGRGVVLEPDVSPGDIVENVIVSNVRVPNPYVAVNITAHSYVIKNIKVENIQGRINLAHNSGGIIENVSLENGYVEGGDYGIWSPNDTLVNNLIVKNWIIRNTTYNGVRVAGGLWIDCVVEGCGQDGFYGGYFTTIPSELTATFIRCKARNNNQANTANGSGWQLAFNTKATLIDCEAIDTQATKTQKYGIMASKGTIVLISTLLSPNATGRTNIISPAVLQEAVPVEAVAGFISDKTSTSATAGTAQALPSNPVGYISIRIGGTEYKIPYYGV